jgi:hypothetical protein
MPVADYGLPNYGSWAPQTWTSNIVYTTATTASNVTIPAATASPAPKPKARAPLEWLADEVDRVCALTRGAA